METPFFVLKIKKAPTKENRIGIIISAAIEKDASRRNFWKRQTKAIFKLLPSANSDLLVIFSKNIKKCTVKKFKEEFLRATNGLNSSLKTELITHQ